MVRLHWIGAVVVGMAASGFALAQQSSMFQPRAGQPHERFMTVREDGHAPQRCKLLKTWREPSGATAYQVQAVDTGELITIVESSPAPGNSGGARTRAMLTRIFRWGGSNQPPDRALTPPPSATVLGTPLSPQRPSLVVTAPPTPYPVMAQPPVLPRTAKAPQPTFVPKAPQQAIPARAAAVSPPMPSAVTPQKPTPLPAPTVSAPIITQPLFTPASPQTPKPSSVVVTAAKSEVTIAPPATPPAEMPTILQGPANQATIRSTPNVSATTPPRLAPVLPGTVVNQTPCDVCCPAACNSCCPPPCNPCCQSSCVCDPCCQPKPSLWSRIFKRNPPCTCVVCDPPSNAPAPAKPAPAVPIMPKVATAPAKPSDWRESWGKVEPWKNTEQRTAQAPVPIDPPAQPDPLKAPDWYHGMAMKQKPASSKAVETAIPFDPPVSYKSSLVKGPPPKPPVRREEAKASPISPRGRPVQLPENEGNAFWTPPAPTPPQTLQAPKYNAFEKDGNTPPRPPMGIAPPLSGVSMGPPPMGPMGPMAMMPTPPRPPSMPPMVDSGVPPGMGNAFTLTGTRRPIPADFGPTPQEPNGFGDAVPYMPTQGPAVPPRYGMMPPMPGMPGYPQQPMPNMMGMVPRGPMMAINPLMAVPPTPNSSAPAGPASVPQIMVALKESQLPSQREWAAEQLSAQNWRTQPQVVASLTTGAREDPAATVRAACVRALVRMKVNTLDVVTVVQDLRNDRDPRVRQEADAAMEMLGVAAEMRPVSHK
jgi:hypothetical protein